jgi:hypothetical protein
MWRIGLGQKLVWHMATCITKLLGFCIEYFELYLHMRCHMWNVNEKEMDIGEVLKGHAKS